MTSQTTEQERGHTPSVGIVVHTVATETTLCGNDGDDDGLDLVHMGRALFGHSKAWANLWSRDKRTISPSERRLVDAVEHRDPVPDVRVPGLNLWLSEKLRSSKMPVGPASIPQPTKKKIRPSTAAGRLQTHPTFSTGLYDEVSHRPSTTIGGRSETDFESSSTQLSRRPATQPGGTRQPWKSISLPEHPSEGVLQARRLTVGTVEGLLDSGFQARSVQPGSTTTQSVKGKIEEKISIDTLEELKRTFLKADANKNGKIDLQEFKSLIKSHLSIGAARENQIDALFMKIDWASEGQITWDEFCTYMQLEYAEKEDSYMRTKEVSFHLPAKIEPIPHRDPILKLTDTIDGSFIACSQDGLVSFWSPNLDLKRTRNVVDNTTRQKPKWITDFVIMSQYNKFIFGTGDRELQFFELSSFEPYCQISGLETVPLRLDYCATGHDECILLYGDSQGCVNILIINSTGECLRNWKKMPKHEGFIASVSLDTVANAPSVQFIRWHVHGDWVQQVQYCHAIRQVISCSNHAATALVIGCTTGSTHVEQQLKEIRDPSSAAEKVKPKMIYAYANTKPRLDSDQLVYKVYKGVKCFDFSKDKNIIVTGGMDRIVRIWNQYVSSKPTGLLRGHNAPIFYLFIANDENRIFSMATDKCIKVWDIQDQSCLLTVRPKGHKIRGDLQAVHYSSVCKTLAVATDQMAVINLRLKPSHHTDIATTHKEPVTDVIYNPSFKQVISCSEASVIKLWDFETGNSIFEFGEAHDDHAITCMSFDNTGRRLITGGRDGCLKIWNYNNGHCLRILKKEKGKEEISGCTYVEMHRNRYVVAVGWDRHINIYSDSLDSNVHHIQYPLPKWADDIQHGHKEDVLSVAQCPPNLLATSSYDGEIIVWNMVSGHIFCHLWSPVPCEYEDESLDGDLSINQLTFLKTRACNKDAASLVASGPRGNIHLWNIFQGGTLMAQFAGSRSKSGSVSCIATTKENDILLSTDNVGFIYVWNISGYCLEGPTSEPPELLTLWRAHVESINAVEIVEEHKIMITCSADCTARMWTFDGEFVGTFGQPDLWDIYNSGTYQHPMVPYDVLIDPQSLPDHPVISEKENVLSVIHDGGSSGSRLSTPTAGTYQHGRGVHLVDDETIANIIKGQPFNQGTGKRLRHEKMKPQRIDRGGPSEYQMLHCYDLEATPQPTPPIFKTRKEDPFEFYD